MRLRLSEEFWRLVESETGKARETVLGPGRDAEAVRVRMILGVILVQEYALKPAEAGQLLDKDRATVTGWVRDHDTRVRYYREYREDYDRLSEVIASYCDSEDIFDLGESFYDVEKAAEQYNFVADNKTTYGDLVYEGTAEPERRPAPQDDYEPAEQERKDGVYLVFPDEDVFYHGQGCGPEAARRCKGIGVKMGDVSFGIVLHDAGDMALVDGESHIDGGVFAATIHDALGDMDGESGTAIFINSLNPDIDLGPWQYIPSVGQLAIMALLFTRINDALSAVGGDPLQSVYYWSSTRKVENIGWVCSLECIAPAECPFDCYSNIRLAFEW